MANSHSVCVSCSMYAFAYHGRHSVEMKIIMENGPIIIRWEIIWRKSFYNLLHIRQILFDPLTISFISLSIVEKWMVGFPFGLHFFFFFQLTLLKSNSDAVLLNCSIQSTCSSDSHLPSDSFRHRGQIDFKMEFQFVSVSSGTRNGNVNEANIDWIMHLVVLEIERMRKKGRR